ncbi:cutile protein, putative [Pediculus humanus corporis]|uniref:Cutile protein, putative n=1 Tax=Pediculus humanus subsp. corporis TaxID=121224 RepID=E0VGS9_PEDHC|nr:cutile protein, putative [Pediculus humanus corporis]EEB12585.1 cutile protein, putative [Pediculus humanus corporis]
MDGIISFSTTRETTKQTNTKMFKFAVFLALLAVAIAAPGYLGGGLGYGVGYGVGGFGVGVGHVAAPLVVPRVHVAPLAVGYGYGHGHLGYGGFGHHFG